MRTLALLLIAFSLSCGLNAQRGNQAWKKYRHEASVGYGLNTFLASIGTDDKIGIRYVLQRSTFNASYRYYFMKHFAVRGSLTHAYSRKNDKTGDPFDLFANVDYEMTLTELAGMCEYHIFDETTRAKKRGKVRRARGGMSKGIRVGLSVFAGVAVDRFRPYGEIWGQQVILKPYDPNAGFTDVKDYPKTHLHIPFGAHVRLIASQSWRVGFEAGYRYGFRSYIDNVSGVYFRDNNPYAKSSEFTDTNFTGQYTTLDRDLNKPISEMANGKGRSGYFFGLLTLSYRIKS